MTARPEFGAAIAVEVTQADRDVATAIVSHTRGFGVRLPNDGHTAIQLVARHRTSTALPLAHPAAPQGEGRKIYVWWADNGNIRKWSHTPFTEGELTLTQDAAPQSEEANVLPDNLAELIEQELNAWRGANGGVYTIHAAALGVSIKIRAAMFRAALAPAAIASGREGAE